MDDARDTITKLLDEMRHYLILAKVPQSQINMRIGRHKIATCITAFDWLSNLHASDVYKNFVWLRDQLPEETWRHYELHEIKGLREQILLEDLGKLLLKEWRNKRPNLFGKNRVKDSEIIIDGAVDTCQP